MFYEIENAIGNTPLLRLSNKEKIYGKFEGQNLYGSAKDRAALYIIKHLLKHKEITKDTEILESSSGNFAIALAGVCKHFGLDFTCVIDPLLNKTNKAILDSLGANLVVVTTPDENNNFLKSRVKKVYEILEENRKAYWINQYDNPLIPNAYLPLGSELVNAIDKIDYIFVPVSTCGTIAGISKYIKSYDSRIKIIAVDLDCSNIFYPAKTKQNIPGMGLFKKPGNLANAQIDDFIIISEFECIQGCRELLNQGFFVWEHLVEEHIKQHKNTLKIQLFIIIKTTQYVFFLIEVNDIFKQYLMMNGAKKYIKQELKFINSQPYNNESYCKIISYYPLFVR